MPPELPPRTRRIRLGARLRVRRSGTTSAYAENTNQGPGHGHRGGNYLRVRGEYRIKAERERKLAELPPRTRRIPAGTVARAVGGGTTSAYAENTRGQRNIRLTTRNYLRVRGEYGGQHASENHATELPPRTRRILDNGFKIGLLGGTTSAYAENTSDGKTFPMIFWNYLRVRGEYAGPRQGRLSWLELPPRTRRIHRRGDHGRTGRGTTSAYAENTLNELGLL